MREMHSRVADSNDQQPKHPATNTAAKEWGQGDGHGATIAPSCDGNHGKRL